MISVFEYITILISIILGLGITKLLAGFATMIVRIRHCNLYWPHILFIILAFLIHIQDWFVTYELRTIDKWNLPLFLFIILYPVTLYLLSYMLFPLKYGNHQYDFKNFFMMNYERIYSLLIVLVILSILQNIYIFHYQWKEQIIQIIISIALIFILVFKLNKSLVHKSLALMLLTFFIISIIFQWNTLIIL